MPKPYRPKKLTEAKIDRARDAIDAILECDDLDLWFPNMYVVRLRLIDAKKELRVTAR